MSPTYKEYVFDFADLNLISVVCGHCKCEAIVDASNALAKMPDTCSSCTTPFQPPFTVALRSFHDAYQAFIKTTGRGDAATARIRIRREVNTTEF